MVLIAAPRLPASMATHFGLNGEVNGFMPTPWALLLQGVAVIGVPGALLVVFVAGRWWRGSSARSLSAIVSGLSAGLTTLFISVTAAHLNVVDPATVRLTAGTGLLALGVTLATLVLVALVLPAPLPRPVAAAVPAMPIAPSERVTWFGEAHTNHAAMLLIGLAVLVVAVAAIATGIHWLWLLDVLLLLLGLGVTRFKVRIDASGVAWRGALGLPRGRVKLADITAVSVTDLSPGDFGGYGIRLLPGKLGLITRSGEALCVTHAHGELVITLDDCRTAASVIEGLRRARAEPSGGLAQAG